MTQFKYLNYEYMFLSYYNYLTMFAAFTMYLHIYKTIIFCQLEVIYG